MRCEVHSRVIGASLGKFQPVRCNTAANFKHLFAFIGRKIGGNWHMPLPSIVSLVRNFLKITLPFGGRRQVGLARAGVPKIPDFRKSMHSINSLVLLV